MKRNLLILLAFIPLFGFGQLNLANNQGRILTFGNVALTSTVSESELFNNGKLVITFDEVNSSQYLTAFPLFQSKNMSATFYIIGNEVAKTGKMTWAQLVEMDASGMDIQCHSFNHPDFDTLTDNEIIYQLESNDSSFTANGLTPPSHIAYPSGVYNFNAKEVTSNYRLTGRTVDANFYPITRYSDKMALVAESIDMMDSSAYTHGGTNGMNVIKGYIDQCKLAKGAMILYSHGVTDTMYRWSIIEEKLAELIDYAQDTAGVDIITISELYGLMYKNEYPNETETFTLTPTGTGTGVSTLTLRSTEDITINITSGGARFYSDAAGTLNESTSWDVELGGDRTIYLKCPSTSNMDLPYEKINRIVTWTSSTNAASLGGDITNFKKLRYFTVIGTNTITGDISNMYELTNYYCYSNNTVFGNIDNDTMLTNFYCGGNNTISGDVSNLTRMYAMTLEGNNTIHGSISNLTELRSLIGYGNNYLSGSVANLTHITYLAVLGTNTISGSVSGLTWLTVMNVQGSNTLSGSVAALTLLNYMNVQGSNTITGSVASLTLLTYINVTGSNTISGSVAALVNLTIVSVSGSNTLTGSISALTKLISMSVSGSNTISGSPAAIPNITTLVLTGNNQLAYDFEDTPTKLVYFSVIPGRMYYNNTGHTFPTNMYRIYMYNEAGYGMSSTQIDNLLIDLNNSLVANCGIQLKGSNSARTSASDAAVSGLLSRSCTVSTN